MKKSKNIPLPTLFRFPGVTILVMFLSLGASAGERLIIELKDFSRTELKCGGFTLSKETKVHIKGLGAGGDKKELFSNSDMYAYAWIIDAGTRSLVWQMTRTNTTKEGKERKFDGEVTLPKGSYEAYFSAYAYIGGSSFTTYNMNVDPRRNDPNRKKNNRDGFFEWFGDMFGEDFERDWKKRSREWGADLYVDDSYPDIQLFSVPKELSYVVFKATKLGESEHVRQQFVVSKQISLRIYALGEMVRNNPPQDYGWIINTRTHKRVWEMERGNLHAAGGAEKNVKFDDTVTLPPGEFTLYYLTDDSHSFVDWNSAPPEDPFNYGITMMTTNEADKAAFKLSSTPSEEKNIIAQITEVGNDETKSIAFLLKEDTPVRIYAIGEASNSRRQMADYGWIINTRTRQKVWTMDYDRTERGGGAAKNRMVDEIITLPKGEYSVMYQTDDSHAFNEWNDSPPFDPEHWGISIYGSGEKFTMSNVELNPVSRNAGVIAQITRVGNNVNRKISFTLSHPTRVRVYAIGEGQNKEMADYGWIENASTQAVIWEMTYSMTFHAGGGRKNRLVNTTMLLDKGEYILQFVSDDSHAYNDWNTDPPDDPTMWGITVMEEKE